MKSFITGCAGFIGSHLVERLLREGHEVVGVDCFTDYYAREIKEANMEGFIEDENFHLIKKDINRLNLQEVMLGVGLVFHQAAQAGVRASWGGSFKHYTDSNVLATQKLLEAAKSAEVERFIYASSSSVYGDTEKLPIREDDAPKPVSPYGVTKLAGEHLCYLYWKNYGVPTIALRYFTVYGPRQRPDMAFHKFTRAILGGEKIQVYGDGGQTRDFTYISDIVGANLLAREKGSLGRAYNIGGGTTISVNDVIKLIEGITGRTANVEYVERQKGDVRDTHADISNAKREIGYDPKVEIEEGLEGFVQWYKRTMREEVPPRKFDSRIS